MKKMVGKVVDENDPKMMGRVRIRINALHKETQDTDLPWAHPSAQSSGMLSIDTPMVGSWVFVDVTDPHEPEYWGNVVSKETLPDFLKVNYPKRKGLQSELLFKQYRDEKDGSFHFESPDGTIINGDGKGNLIVTAPSDKGSITLQVGNTSMIMNKDGTVFTGQVTFESPVIAHDTITGDKNITSSTDVVANGISLHDHTHKGVQTGSGVTGKPQ